MLTVACAEDIKRIADACRPNGDGVMYTTLDELLITVTPGESVLAKIYRVLLHHPNAAACVRVLIIDGMTKGGPTGIIRFQEVYAIARLLTGLVTLEARDATWASSGADAIFGDGHTDTLSACSMRFLKLTRIKSPENGTSPLEIVKAKGEWEEIELSALAHPACLTVVDIPTVKVHTLVIRHWASRALTFDIPVAYAVFRDVRHLKVFDVDVVHMDPFQSLLAASAHSLETLYLSIRDPVTEPIAERWLGLEVPLCATLRKLGIAIQVPEAGFQGVEKDRMRGTQIVLEHLLRLGRSSLSVGVELWFNGENNVGAQIEAIDWNRLGGLFSPRTLGVFTIVLVGVRSAHRSWSQDREQMIQRGFGWLEQCDAWPSGRRTAGRTLCNATVAGGAMAKLSPFVTTYWGVH